MRISTRVRPRERGGRESLCYRLDGRTDGRTDHHVEMRERI